MEKYTKENMAGLSHEELESAVLELQRKLEEEKKNSEMYKGWWDNEGKKCGVMKARLDVISNLLRTWE